MKSKAISFVLLRASALVDPAEIVRAYATMFGGERLVSDEVRPCDVATIHAIGANTLIASMPKLLEGGDAEGSVKNSLSGLPPDGFVLPAYKAYIAVGTEGHARTRLATLQLHCRIVAAVTKVHAGLAVYDANAHATHDARFYLEFASREVPLPLWSGVKFTRTGKRVELLSLGMTQLMLPNLKISAPESRTGEALSFLFDLLMTSIVEGPFKNGSIVGRTSKEQMKVKYEPLTGDQKVPVGCIEMP